MEDRAKETATDERPSKRQKKKSKESKQQVVSWCFNYFNVGNHQIAPPKPRWDDTIMKFLAYQLERGDENGGLHWQGMVQFKRSQRRSFVQKNCLIDGAHCDPTRFDDAAQQYCSKSKTSQEGTFERFGVFTNTTIPPAENFVTRIEEGYSKRDMLKFQPGLTLQHWNKFESVRSCLKPLNYSTSYLLDNFTEDPQDLRKAVLFFGPSGIGKTHFALAHFKNPFMVSHIEQLLEYTPDYDGIVFDDIDFRDPQLKCSFADVLALIDMEFSRILHVRFKTVQVPKVPRIFTHNTPNIFDLHGLATEQYAAIERRVFKREFSHDLIKK